MRSSAHLAAICVVVTLVTASSAQTQKEIANPQEIASAKTIYFEDKSGVDAVGKKAASQIKKASYPHGRRFEIVARALV
jgi:hypothetical protein